MSLVTHLHVHSHFTLLGATAADWSEETKLLVVSYDASKTSNTGIQKKVAAVGYDTQDVKAKDGDYKKLDKCCQYNRSGNSAKSIDSIPANCCQGIENCTKDGCCKAGMTCCKDKADKADCCANGKCKSGNK